MSTSQPNHTLRSLLPILAILLLALALRLVGIADRPVWTDEGWSAWAAAPQIEYGGENVLQRVAVDRHPPLYFGALSLWWSAAGGSHLALRLLSVWGGVLTVAVTYRLGLDWFGRRAATYAALFLALLAMAVYYAQEIRNYGWLVLTIALMTLFFLRYLRRPSRANLIGYTVSMTAMLYTLYLGALIVALQGLFGLFLWRGSMRNKGRLFAAWIGAGLLFLPWFLVLVQQQGISSFFGGVGDRPWTYATSLDSLRMFGAMLFSPQIALMLGLYVFGAWAMLTPSPALPRKQGRVLRGGVADRYILAAGIGYVIAVFAVNPWFGMLAARILVIAVPLLVLPVGYGLSLIQPPAQGILAVVLVAVLLLSPAQTIQPRLNLDEAATIITEGYNPGDVVILELGWDDNAAWYEVSRKLGGNAAVIRTLPWVNHVGEAEPALPHLAETLNNAERVWVMQWFQPPEVSDALAAGHAGYRPAILTSVPAGEVYATEFDAPTIQVGLFEKVTDEPHSFGDILTLHDALLPDAIQAGIPLHVDLWWSAPAPPELDYSVGVFLGDESGTIITNHQGPPGDMPTTQWQSDTLIFDRHALPIPADLPPGEYSVLVNAYWYGDQVPLIVEGGQLLEVGTITVRE